MPAGAVCPHHTKKDAILEYLPKTLASSPRRVSTPCPWRQIIWKTRHPKQSSATLLHLAKGSGYPPNLLIADCPQNQQPQYCIFLQPLWMRRW